MSIQAFVNIKQNFKIDTLLHRQPMKFFFSKTEWRDLVLGHKKVTVGLHHDLWENAPSCEPWNCVIHFKGYGLKTSFDLGLKKSTDSIIAIYNNR